jgi:glycosyltransferase involved in cell wall biosynthesis
VKVLLVEPYLGGSHADWAHGLVRHSAHEVVLVAHPGRHWRWRFRGGPVTLAEQAAAIVAERGRPDVVLVSGMTDVAAFCGLSRRWLGDLPVGLYLHESQVLHPARAPGEGGAEGVYANWRSMAATDHTYVASEFHRRTLLDALPGVLADVPDQPHNGLLDEVAGRTSVLPVGVEVSGLIAADRPPPDGGPPLVLWPHRWDHDKRPEAFLRVLVALAGAGVDFRVALAGANTRMDPREFDEAVAALGERVVHIGHVPRADYEDLLLRSDVVVSTAAHEFFGVSTVEAIAAGAVPLLPQRLSYPELVPTRFHDAVLYRHSLFDRLREVLEDLTSARRRVAGLRASMAGWSWEELAPRYDRELSALAEPATDRAQRGRR